jgi:site-specific DNA recombinase
MMFMTRVRLADIASFHDRLMFANVRLFTVSTGEVTAMHIGLLGTMAQLFLSDLRDKTRRGMLGRARAGRIPGGQAYAYDIVEPEGGARKGARGERRINPVEAAIVIRIFREFAAGRSPRDIAKRLNREKIPAPDHRFWSDTTIRGQRDRGTGLLNNPIYIGRLEWNRTSYVKDPRTGKRIARVNPLDQREIVDIPELRIVDDELWAAVKARQEQIRNLANRRINCPCAGRDE